MQDLSDARVPSLSNHFHQVEFGLARKNFFLNTDAVASRSEACEGAPSASTRVCDETASVVPPDGKHQLPESHDVLKAEGIAWARLLYKCSVSREMKAVQWQKRMRLRYVALQKNGPAL